eukprot:12803211-Alexandrium_andersonii.AAC.1
MSPRHVLPSRGTTRRHGERGVAGRHALTVQGADRHPEGARLAPIAQGCQEERLRCRREADPARRRALPGHAHLEGGTVLR